MFETKCFFPKNRAVTCLPGLWFRFVLPALVMISALVGNAAAQPAGGAAINIKAAGARCDGTTDDYAAISGALQRAAASRSTVLFPPSPTPCMISRNLKLPDGVTIRAAAGTATLKATPDNSSSPVLLGVHNDDRIIGLAFDGGGKDEPNGANVIQGFQAHNVLFDQIAVRHTHGAGLVMSTGIANSTVKDSVFEDIGNHWKSTGQPKDRKQGVVFCCGTGNISNVITNDRFVDIGLDALQISDQSNVTVSFNHFNLGNGERNGLHAPDYPAAIFSMHVERANIINNVIAEALGNCIDAPGIVNSVIAHNVINGCGAAGIGLFDARSYGKPEQITDHVTLTGNTIANYGQWAHTMHPGGLTVGGVATNLSLSGNTFAGTRAGGAQRFAVFGLPRAVVTGISVDGSNRFSGGPQNPFGGTMAGARP